MLTIRVLLLSCIALLCACAGKLPERPGPAAAAASSKAPPPIASATDAALRSAQAKIDQAKKLSGRLPEAEATLKEARAAAKGGNDRRAQSLAHDAQSRAETAIDGQYVTQSAQKLHALYAVTGLSDQQLADMRAAEVALVRGEGARAYALLEPVEKAVKAGRSHQVAAGESLWTIAGRDDVYSNSLLWPLVWEANRDRIKNPNVLYQGQVLKIRANPTVDEVVRAVEYARSQLGAQVKIGEVKEASP